DMDLGLRNKVAVITGGSVGIGLAAARAFAREGAGVVIAARGGARAEAEAKAITAEFGTPAWTVAADVATAEGCQAVLDAVAAGPGGADLFFSNAGTGSNETVAEASDAKWQYYWD